MNDTIARVAERIRQQRSRDNAGVSSPAPLVQSAEARTGMTFAPGDRVHDSVTGLEGMVEVGKRATVIVPPAKE